MFRRQASPLRKPHDIVLATVLETYPQAPRPQGRTPRLHPEEVHNAPGKARGEGRDRRLPGKGTAIGPTSFTGISLAYLFFP